MIIDYSYDAIYFSYDTMEVIKLDSFSGLIQLGLQQSQVFIYC
jgi:hypothetical protein